jgi:hypothetical protein
VRSPGASPSPRHPQPPRLETPKLRLTRIPCHRAAFYCRGSRKLNLSGPVADLLRASRQGWQRGKADRSPRAASAAMHFAAARARHLGATTIGYFTPRPALSGCAPIVK